MARLEIDERAWSDPRLMMFAHDLKIDVKHAIGILATMWHRSQSLGLHGASKEQIQKILGEKSKKFEKIFSKLLENNYIFQKNSEENFYFFRGNSEKIQKISVRIEQATNAVNKRWNKLKSLNKDDKNKDLSTTEKSYGEYTGGQEKFSPNITYNKIIDNKIRDSKIVDNKIGNLDLNKKERVDSNKLISKSTFSEETEDRLKPSESLAASTHNHDPDFFAEFISRPPEVKFAGLESLANGQKLSSRQEPEKEITLSAKKLSNDMTFLIPGNQLGKTSKIRKKTERLIKEKSKSEERYTHNTKDALAFYFEAYKRIHGIETIITGSDAGSMKSLLKEVPNFEKLKLYIESYLKMKNKWFQTMKWDVKTLKNNIKAVKEFADTGFEKLSGDIEHSELVSHNEQILNKILAKEREGDSYDAEFSQVAW